MAAAVVPPKGAPNVLLIMTDDQGYGVSGTFGGVIPTPAMDRIAKAGLRYTQFHSTALCSPTRAALITGRNHHSVGLRRDRASCRPAIPGYDSVIGPDNATIGTILKRERLCHVVVRQEPQHAELSSTARRGRSTSGRSGMGFEYFYGFMGGETDQWTPYLFRNHDPDLSVDRQARLQPHHRHGGRGDQLHEAAQRRRARQAVLRLLRARRHATRRTSRRRSGSTSSRASSTWAGTQLREQIFANQKRLGVIPANTQLTPWPDDLPKWDTLSADEKKLFARQAEVFAGYAAYTDHEIGRVIQAVEDMGKLDNTLIIYISGDNGTSAEGTLDRHAEPDDRLQRHSDVPVAEQMKFYDAWGSDETYPHMSVAWSWAFDTPFKWTKQVASHFGGTRQGMAMSWPGRIKDAGGIRTPVPPRHRHRADDPRSHRHPGAGDGRRHRAEADRRREHGLHLRQGERQRAVDAQDAVFRDVRQPRHLPRRLVRQHDAAGCRRGCMGTAKLPDVVNGYKWELYNLAEDYSQTNDLAAKNARQAARRCRSCSWWRRRSTRCSRWTTRSCRASSRRGRARPPGGPSSPTRARMPAFPIGDAPEHPEQVLHHHRRGGGPAGRRRRDARHRRAAASAATASTCSRASRCSPTTSSIWSGSAGRARRQRARAGQAHDRVRLHVRRPRLRQGRHRRAEGGRQGGRHAERSRTRSRS